MTQINRKRMRRPKHPNANSGGHVFEHILVAEKSLGKILDQRYHMLLHRRTTALEECGNANAVKCVLCGEYIHRINTEYSWYVGKFKTFRVCHKVCSFLRKRGLL